MSFFRFYVNVDVRAFPVRLLQFVFYGGSLLVCLEQRHISVHPHMDINGIMTSYTARAQMMGLRHPLERKHDAGNVLLDVVGQRAFEQLIDTGFQLLHRHLDDEQADNHGRQRVEHTPVLSQQNRSPDSDRRTDGRKRVAPVMPGIGHHRRTVVTFSDNPGVMKQHFLGNDGNQSGHESDPSGRIKALPPEETGDIPGALQSLADTYEDDLQVSLRMMSSMIEPILIIVMALFVGFILLGILSAMFSLTSNINR